ncbi:Fimbrial assembly protein (PilN) [compost metagenome]
MRIKQLDDIKLQRRQLLERMQVIQGLQGGRSNMAQLLDQLTRTLPEGVYFTALKRSGQTLSITGKADSNNRVSQLMRNLEASAQFQMPSLTRVKAAGDNVSAQAGTFELTVGQDPAGLGQ